MPGNSFGELFRVTTAGVSHGPGYVVSYIDRVNVSFANLRMSADLGFSDRVYGLGVGMFFLS